MSDIEYDYSLSAAVELKFSLLAQLVFPSTYWSQFLLYILNTGGPGRVWHPGLFIAYNDVYSPLQLPGPLTAVNRACTDGEQQCN